MGDAAYPDDWGGWLHEAETRIVECIPKASGHRRACWASVPRVRGLRTATRGLIAAPWTPASLSLLPGKSGLTAMGGRESTGD